MLDQTFHCTATFSSYSWPNFILFNLPDQDAYINGDLKRWWPKLSDGPLIFRLALCYWVPSVLITSGFDMSIPMAGTGKRFQRVLVCVVSLSSKSPKSKGGWYILSCWAGGCFSQLKVWKLRKKLFSSLIKISREGKSLKAWELV